MRLPFARSRMLRGAMLVACTALLSGAALPRTVDTSIADAEMRGDTAAVRALIKQGADVNAAQGDGMTALHWAADHGDVEQTRMLIYAGARLEAATRNGNYTPLHLAARSGKASVVKALLDAGANVKAATSSGGATPLHFAAENGNPDAVLALLEKGAPVDARETAFGQTPLMWAAAFNRANAVQVLASHGADLKAVSRIEDIAAQEKNERAALQLRARRLAALKAAEQPIGAGTLAGGGRCGAAPDSTVLRGRGGSPVEAQPAPGGMMPKTQASPATAKSAAKSDTTKNAKTDASIASKNAGAGIPSEGRGRGNAAADTGQQQGGGRGLGYGDLVGNKGGLTPLLFAVRQGNTESVNALLKAGADVNQVSAGDHTSPLLMATINGQFDIAKGLLAKGANPKLASDAGNTPLYATINVQWAAKSLYPQPTAQLKQQTTYLELMEGLLKAGADPNARLSKHLWYMSYNFDLLGVNTTGATPFWRAAYGTDVPAMKLLMKYGADPKIPTTKPVGRLPGADAPAEAEGSTVDPSGLPPIPNGGPGVYAIHAASGVGYGEGYAANSHQHAPDSWLPAVKYLVEELGADVNARDFNGYTPLHHAAARGDNELIQYLVSKGADITVVSRKGQTVADMANGPVQRIPPFLETVALAEKLGSKNSHKCKSC
jgi:ankyrin repeat protein